MQIKKYKDRGMNEEIKDDMKKGRKKHEDRQKKQNKNKKENLKQATRQQKHSIVSLILLFEILKTRGESD